MAPAASPDSPEIAHAENTAFIARIRAWCLQRCDQAITLGFVDRRGFGTFTQQHDQRRVEVLPESMRFIGRTGPQPGIRQRPLIW
jgi:hypothetical protein